MAEDSGDHGPVLFKKKRGPSNRSNLAKSVVAEPSTSRRDDSEDEASGSAVIVKKKRTAQNPLVQSTGSTYKKFRQDNQEDEAFDEALPSIDQFGDNDITSQSQASGLIPTHRNRDDATKHSNWDLEGAPPEPSDTFTNSNGTYQGAKGYASYLPKRDDGSSSKMKSRGPIRQQTTVRSVTLMDYQPDVCKDYKETGYCGFGDTCKFLHDRSDYLAGWQLDALPNSTKRGREDVLSDSEDADSADEEEAIPFACLLCRQPFTDPVVTRCNHYFCAACAIKRYAKTPKCFACGAQTGGLFNSATKIIQKMQLAKQRKDNLRTEKRVQRGLDDDDEADSGQILDGVEIEGESD